MEQFDDLYNLSRLITGYLKDDLNDQEQQQLQNWLEEKPENRAQFDHLIAESKLKSDFSGYGQTHKTAAWKRIVRETGYRTSKKVFSMPRIAAAASILIGLSLSGYFFLHKQPAQQISQNKVQDIAPGGNKAILTLSNGQKVSLTDAENGNIAQQSGTQIKKAQNGQVVYLANSLSTKGANAKEVVYNTISTPRGGQWQLILPDGSRVWLNAASSITFPTAFTSNNRIVKITGEAYFEVVHNAAKPFRVTTKDQTIEDIGTHFNINAYDDEGSIRTTLVEGSVKVSNATGSATLTPGQQSIVQNDNKIVVTQADLDEAIAWKNGLFHFDRADIQTIMREFARWYDVDVQYNGNIPRMAFNGNIDRNSNASVALQVLSVAGVNFKIEGKKIIVQP
jgi:ferric-dicitrate binding protein FerR (iron transport regulator)